MSDVFSAFSDEDVLAVLPPTSAVKFSQLIGLRDDARGAFQFYSSKERALYDRIMSLEGELKRLHIDSPPRSWSARLSEPGEPREPEEVVKEKLAAAREEFERVKSMSEVRSKVDQAHGAITEMIKRWVQNCPDDTVFAPYEGAPLKRSIKKPTQDDVDRCREDRQLLVIEYGKVRRAPMPKAELQKLVRDKVEALGHRGMPDIMDFTRDGEKIVWPSIQLTLGAVTGRGEESIRGYAAGKAPDVVGFLCWLEPERVIAALDKEIEALVNDEDALSDEQRASRKKKLLSDILDLERVEEGLIELAALHGTTIFRRPDADPRAILNLSSELPGPRLV